MKDVFYYAHHIVSANSYAVFYAIMLIFFSSVFYTLYILYIMV